MSEITVAVALGGISGLLTILAYRFRLAWLGWLLFAPLAAAVYWSSPLPAGLAGAGFGILAWSPIIWGRFPRMGEVVVTAITAISSGAVFALAAWLWPNGFPAWGALVMPIAAVVLSGAPRLGGYGGPFPRWGDPFLGSQDEALPVVHIARLGSDLAIPALLALSATVPVMLLVVLPPSPATVAVAVVAGLVLGSALSFGLASYRRAVHRVEAGDSLLVAAVSVDAPFDGYTRSPAYQDDAGTVRRYQPHVARAIAQGAHLIVLPEHAMVVNTQTRERWLAAVAKWAKDAQATFVTGLFDTDLQTGQLVIVDETGTVVATYEKQHPMIGAEPKRRTRMPPALFRQDPFPVSGVICVDLDYADMIPPVTRAGGVLAVPANDWAEVIETHYRSAVWSVVMAGVPMVRSAGHGMSAVYDGAGRILAKANSFDGPVVLVIDMPVSAGA